MFRSLLMLFAVFALSGCAGDQANRQAVKFDDPSRMAVPPASGAPVAVPSLPRAEIIPLPPSISHEEFSTSQNAMSQGFSGMGAQIGKVADHVDASLARLDTNVNLQSTATAKAIAKFSVNFQNKIAVQTKAIARVNARLDAVAQAQGNAQAAIGSKLESVQQSTNAGRDSTQIQFTREMRDTFLAMFHETIAIVAILGLVMVLLQHRCHIAAMKTREDNKCEPQFSAQSYRSAHS